jgi:hypothetical protein
MNEFLPTRFVENVRRLALGLEPIDAERGTRVAHPIRVTFAEEARGLTRPVVDRHDSCLHALLYTPGLAGRVRLRFIEEQQRFVPRLISYPILPVEEAEPLPDRRRVRRPRLFPGAAYDVSDAMTGVRGRVRRAVLRDGLPVLRDGRPVLEAVRWARVVARVPGNGAIVGRAHGDQHGEFLLLISSRAGAVGDLVDPLPVRVDVFALPRALAASTPPRWAAGDPWWDLPEEEAPADPETDLVSSGEAPVDDYTATVGRTVMVSLGRIQSETTVFQID